VCGTCALRGGYLHRGVGEALIVDKLVSYVEGCIGSLRVRPKQASDQSRGRLISKQIELAEQRCNGLSPLSVEDSDAVAYGAAVLSG
jgi:hypothetical protein